MASFNLNYFVGWSGPLVVVSQDGRLADWTSDNFCLMHCSHIQTSLTGNRRKIYDFPSLPPPTTKSINLFESICSITHL